MCTLKLLHALINLSGVYKKIRHGETDRTLDSRIDELIGKLMQKKTNELNMASTAILYKEMNGNFVGADDSAWWILVFIHIKRSTNSMQLYQELVNRLKKVVPIELMTWIGIGIGIGMNWNQPNVQSNE